MRLLRAATLITPDPEVSARRYEHWFGYCVAERGVISGTVAEDWGAPAMEGRRYAVVAPDSGMAVHLRFVEGVAPSAYRPLRSFGWAAIELCVRDVQATHERMKRSPFEIIGPPRALDGVPKIWPMQVRGPDGEVIFLTEIRGDESFEKLPRAEAEVDGLFIAVLACSDIAATAAWFAEHLGLTARPEIELAYTTLSRAFDVPVTTKHRIAVLTHEGDAFLQIDQYPANAEARVARPGELPPGIAMVSFFGDGAGHKILRAPDGTLVELTG